MTHMRVGGSGSENCTSGMSCMPFDGMLVNANATHNHHCQEASLLPEAEFGLSKTGLFSS